MAQRTTIAKPSTSAEDELTPEQLIFFKKKLLDRKRVLLETHHKGTKTLKSHSENGKGDFGDKSSFESDLAVLTGASERTKTELKKIDKALDKIKAGTFGLCEECEELINIRRLSARIHSSNCITCQTEKEKSS